MALNKRTYNHSSKFQLLQCLSNHMNNIQARPHLQLPFGLLPTCCHQLLLLPIPAHLALPTIMPTTPHTTVPVGASFYAALFRAGTNAKHGLRCKACKLSIHHKCAESTGQQRCMGKLPKGFRRYYSSPLLIHEQFGCIKEVMPIACGNKVDPVYETLRFGTSLAQKTKKGSTGSSSDSPKRNSTSDLAEVPEERGSPGNMFDINRQRSNSVFTYSVNGVSDFGEEPKKINSVLQGSLNKDTVQMNTYVALYKFVPQEHEDLEMRPGDRITLLEDSNEDWWKGKIEDRIGFFPANFVQRLQDEKVFKCIRTFIGCKEQGQITLKENQICITSEKEHNGFIKVCSGKKKGFVPVDVLENI
ncbi:SH3 and cysteine-rich domain-containing protein [Python bivittatus]|uniref:SH3 and cysteine-rich domain-containing protein n=1 Tax=Python bivittatus TaxID=176946 RepID=A0A9F2R6F3_PYTBI|nr:SH3 and cysteine-rich domain-containing protein [Python bivittatus]